MPSSAELEVQFHYTLWDRIRSGVVMSFQNWSSALWALALPTAGLVLLGVSAYYGRAIELRTAGIIALCFLFFPVFAVYPAVQAHFFGDRAKKPFNYQFGPFGVRAYSDTSELTQSWKAISKVKRRGGFLLLFFTPKCAHCLPYSTLEELGAVEPIVQLAREHGVPVYGI